MRTGYLAPLGLEDVLKKELQGIVSQYGRLFIADGPPQKVHWIQNIWYEVKELRFSSISDAARQLRAMQGLWAHYPLNELRKGELISSRLPFFSPKPIPFPGRIPPAPLGSWTLLDDKTMLAAARCSSPFAHGELHFQETPIPPSRAYLKLWEFFTLTKERPKAGERCLEVGASPGSWTWVLQKLGAEVIAVDRAPLTPEIVALPQIQFMKKDAFSLGPDDFSDLDWLFCDVVCYPEKLLKWLDRWIQTDIRLVCTLKFQGNSDYAVLREFERIEGSQLLHLSHNKHELTWWKK